jgi:hypothetical protein
MTLEIMVHLDTVPLSIEISKLYGCEYEAVVSWVGGQLVRVLEEDNSRSSQS